MRLSPQAGFQARCKGLRGGVLSGFGIDWLTLPGTGGEDDSKEPVGRLNAPGAVDDACHSHRGWVQGQPGLPLEFAGGCRRDGFSLVCFSRREVPVERGEL